MKLKKRFSKNIVFVLAIIFTSFFCFNESVFCIDAEYIGGSGGGDVKSGCGYFASHSYSNRTKIFRFTLISDKGVVVGTKDFYINDGNTYTFFIESLSSSTTKSIYYCDDESNRLDGSNTSCDFVSAGDVAGNISNLANVSGEDFIFMGEGANSFEKLKELLSYDGNSSLKKIIEKITGSFVVNQDNYNNYILLVEPVYASYMSGKFYKQNGVCKKEDNYYFIGTLNDILSAYPQYMKNIEDSGTTTFSDFSNYDFVLTESSYFMDMIKSLYVSNEYENIIGDWVFKNVDLDNIESRYKQYVVNDKNPSSLARYLYALNEMSGISLYSSMVIEIDEILKDKPVCEYTKIIADCIDDFNITTNQNRKCYLENEIAYEKKDGTKVSSYNKEIGAYCYETISSNFPKSYASFGTFKSGSLFKTQSLSNYFGSNNEWLYGTVTISRHCETKDGKFVLGNILDGLIDSNENLLVKPSISLVFNSKEYNLKVNGISKNFIGGNETSEVASGTGKIVIGYMYPLYYVKKQGSAITSLNCIGCSKFGFGIPIDLKEPTNQKEVTVKYSIEDNRTSENNLGGLFNIPYGKYRDICNYKIYNEIIDTGEPFDDDDDKINLEFRIIDTKYPFVNGSGLSGGTKRNVGTNWQSDSDTTPDNEIVQKYIKEANDSFNKNKTGAMYSITLTPTDIKEIRNYNKKNKYDDYKLECNNEGNNCISGFISDYVYKNKITGLCTTDKFRAAGLPDDIFNNKCLK